MLRQKDCLLISRAETYKDEANIINRLFEQSLSCLYLRKPKWSALEYESLLKQIKREHREKIVVHAQAPLDNQWKLAGRHTPFHLLNETKKQSIGASVHSWTEYQAIYEQAAYICISPFFDSISKSDYLSNQSLWEIPSNVALDKAVALGGINTHNIPELVQLGIHKFAVLGAVWKSENPIQTFLQIQDQINKC